MKNKWSLFVSIIQLVFGLLAIASFIILAIDDEKMIKWIIELIAAIFLVITGIFGIIHYKKQ